MRFLHLADLHFGKSIYGTSLLESGDQGVWVDRFLELTARVCPDTVVIAGDVYDRSAPSGDAVQLLSRMLTRLSEFHIPALLCAGNHDSVQRLSFAGPLLAREGVHISGSLYDNPVLSHVTLKDEHGPVTFWLMPYVFPALIAGALRDESLRTGDAAVRALLAAQPIDFTQRNVLIAHQNVTANGAEGERGGSESMVGGVGQIDYKVFDGFDYVALGHIHAAYPVGRETVRYAGTPLCYHFNETKQPARGPVLVELGTKGETVNIETLVIPPLHPMREIRGGYEEVREAELNNPRRGEYLRIVLTDRRVSPEISAFFHELYAGRDSVLMELCSEFTRFSGEAAALSRGDVEQKSTETLFADFFTERSGGEPPADEDAALLAHAGELLRHADSHTAPDTRDVEKLLAYLTRQEAEK
ncbi:MAG: exonuclease SbcCD subunit D [Oscillospiraceae bacterium]|nr:exonuclease SbcCD subunit D [Oscillospiraceae bacterium]MBR7073812.1 exonuclease SbcCD subunit D [Oscillospiraceae bacterium]